MPAKQEIVITAPMYPPTLTALDADFVTHRLWEAKDRAAFLAPLRDRVTAVCTMGETGADAALMDALPKAKIIASNSVGVDAIDLAAAKARGVVVTNTPGVLTDCVADLGMALTLAVARRVVEADRYVRSGQWPKGAFSFGTKLGGKTMGIVGMGRIGQAVARRARGFGLSIHYHNRRRVPESVEQELEATYWESLDQMLARMDVISVNCPHTPATYHLLSARRLKLLRPHATLVNTSRGEVIDEEALTRMLIAREIAGAGLDVFEREPAINPKLLKLENVVLLPHMGSATLEGRIDMGEKVIVNIKTFIDGHHPPDRVIEGVA